MRRKATWGILGLLALGFLWAYYMGDQTGRVAENATNFTIDTRDPDSVVLAQSIAQGEDSSTSFVIDTRDLDSVVLAQSIAQGEESTTSFVIDTRDPDSVVLETSTAVVEESASFTIDTRSADPPTWGETSNTFTIDTREADAVVLALSIAQVEESPSFTIDTRDPLPLDSDNDGIHDFWENMYFGGIFAQNADGDSDGDGLDNFAEFAFGTDPTKADSIANGPSSINVAIQLAQVNGTWVLTLSYPRHVLAARSVRYAYEVAPAIAGSWTDTTAAWTEVGEPVTLNGYVERVTVCMPLASKPAQIFVRIQAYRQ